MTCSMARSCAPTKWSSMWMVCAPRSLSSSARPSQRWCCSTTMTSPTRRSVLTPTRSPWRSITSRTSKTRLLAPLCGARHGMPPATAKAPRATTCAWCSATSPARPSQPPSEPHSASSASWRSSMWPRSAAPRHSHSSATPSGRLRRGPPPALTPNSSSSSSSRRTPRRPSMRRRSPDFATARPRSRDWRSTPTSAGRFWRDSCSPA